MGFEFLREIPRSRIMDLKVFFIDTIKFANLLYYSEPLMVAIPVLYMDVREEEELRG